MPRKNGITSHSLKIDEQLDILQWKRTSMSHIIWEAHNHRTPFKTFHTIISHHLIEFIRCAFFCLMWHMSGFDLLYKRLASEVASGKTDKKVCPKNEIIRIIEANADNGLAQRTHSICRRQLNLCQYSDGTDLASEKAFITIKMRLLLLSSL